uniref:Acetyl-coenzyme A carboxylase carboxyl transferase subunit beta n=1 Tax=Cuscuta bonafortunae TaxID=1197926 RepID=A0A4Y6GUV4_9ASTE|nr:acetyl-CoA carboxylase carboxyltransferase beta subunit [Cuscuta bonafortunae]QDF46542.1 acetyl-CoA carboxylase carboxyltransferase beta subunit [Cuscuta bonafortunae]
MQRWIDNSFHNEFEHESNFGSLIENDTNPNFDLDGGDPSSATLMITDEIGEKHAEFDITSYILENDPIFASSNENYLRAEEGISLYTYRYLDQLIVCGDEKAPQEQKDRTEFIKQEQLQLIRNRNPEHHRTLWDQCENCFIPNYKKVLKSNMQICEECGSYFKMTSSDRIELLIDEGTWNPLDQDMFSLDSIEFDSEAELEWYEDSIQEWNDKIYKVLMRKLYTALKQGQELEITANLIEELWLSEDVKSEEKLVMDENWTKPNLDQGEESQDEEKWIFDLDEDEKSQDEEEWMSELDEDGEANEEEDAPYGDRLIFYKKETGLRDAVKTGVGKLNGLPVALGVMDFRFLAGSMGCVVGEKITRLIEHATKNLLPLILLSASGGARVHEGSLSLMQMAKISSALYDYQSNKRLFYLSIITSPTTGGVTASFAMLGDIIITEPGTFVAFAGPRVVQQILNETIPEEEQEAESLFEKGFFDLIVPRHLLKSVISELFKLHAL